MDDEEDEVGWSVYHPEHGAVRPNRLVKLRQRRIAVLFEVPLRRQ